MPSDNDKKDIEIIPPDGKRRREQDSEWVSISFDGSANPFKELPLHKRILLAAAWLAGAIILGAIVFLIIASAVLIWIPLLLATILIASLIVLFRRQFRR
jgi:fatty acid desaturase